MAAAQAPEFTFTDEKGVTHVHSYGMIVFRPEGRAVGPGLEMTRRQRNNNSD